jgi:hypothetical protein
MVSLSSTIQFFLWKKIEANVYRIIIKDLDDFQITIIQEIEVIKKESLQHIL